MKNIHTLSTNKLVEGKNIYITSDEEIKEGDWFIANNGVHQCIRVDENTSCPFIILNSKGEEIGHFKTWKTKIILTTDQDLVKDGVQAIDDEFLEWFVKNPSCDKVEVVLDEDINFDNNEWIDSYHIIIPKEEPTLANMKCICMRFEANCFSGMCRNCGFPPKRRT